MAIQQLDEINKGSYREIRFRVREKDGVTPRNLNGDTLRAVAKIDIKSPALAIEKLLTDGGIVLEDQTNEATRGYARIILHGEDTVNLDFSGKSKITLQFEIEHDEPSGNFPTSRRFILPVAQTVD